MDLISMRSHNARVQSKPLAEQGCALGRYEVEDLAALVDEVVVVLFDGLIERRNHMAKSLPIIGGSIADDNRNMQVDLFDIVDESVVLGKHVGLFVYKSWLPIHF